MLKFLDTLAHRLKLLRYGDATLVEALERTKGELEHSRKMRIVQQVKLTRAQEGLGNISAHADYALKNGQPEVFLAALRDYAEEAVFDPSKRRYEDMDGVSAKARWGYDFAEPPGYLTPQAPKRVTY
ncbi:MAG: hypothetical protein EPO41_03880 [Reyranella sp.]|uniref:hypothetical protein n=1 Tax=Reyranella sp. TaxID=1929291 RepID=UPI0012293B77|nr:hypothetical protein [Reyranella sp.]TAJ97141.1 MAG: hypothetical protein EPO41_03880 [Reyranella sp.]